MRMSEPTTPSSSPSPAPLVVASAAEAAVAAPSTTHLPTRSYLTHPSPAKSRTMSVLKRVTDKFSHLSLQSNKAGMPGSAPQNSAATASVAAEPAILYSSDHRGSISTDSTAHSEWSKRRDSNGDAASTTTQNNNYPLKPVRPKGTYRLSDFIIHRTLGMGSFGRVHLVRSKHNLRFYAIKVLSKAKVHKTKQVEHTNNEQRMLEAVQHPFIINLWGTFQDATNLYMVMDFVPGGELFTLLRRSNRFPDPVAKFYAAEVALALNHLHSLDIIYRDLKPENILLNADGHVKIADFGFAKYCPNMTWTLCGTPDYLAPEIIGKNRYNKSVDWYALGVLIFEMLFGVPPYHQAEQPANPIKLYEDIIRGPAHIRWPPFNPHATDLIMKLMEGEPSKRYGNLKHGAGDVFAHPWFREVDWAKLLDRGITAPYLPKISGDGDASAFEKYPEDAAAAALYGAEADDPLGALFPGFDYTG